MATSVAPTWWRVTTYGAAMKLHASGCALSHRSRRTPPLTALSTSRPFDRPLHDAGIVSRSVPRALSEGSRPFVAASHGYQFPYHDANAPSRPSATLRATRGCRARERKRTTTAAPESAGAASRTRAVSPPVESVTLAPAAPTDSSRIPPDAT